MLEKQRCSQTHTHALLAGYLCHVRSNGTLLLVLCVPHVMLLPSVQQHPCLASLLRVRHPLRRRVAAVLHLSPCHVRYVCV